jgi:hypothetical protein
MESTKNARQFEGDQVTSQEKLGWPRRSESAPDSHSGQPSVVWLLLAAIPVRSMPMTFRKRTLQGVSAC